MKKIITRTLIAMTSVSFLATLWLSPSFNWITFWDFMFILSLLLLIVGASMYIIQVGFFNVFIINVRSFMKKVDHIENMANQVEQKSDESTFFSVAIPVTMPFIISGGILFIISLIISIVI